MSEARPPDGSRKRLAQARALLELGRPRPAATMLQGMVGESPEDSEILALLTYAYIDLADLERALACAERCIAAAPAAGIGHRYRASIMTRLGRFEEARESAVRAVERSPEDVWSHHVLVDALLKSMRIAEAREAATRLVALAPAWAGAHDAMGRVAFQEKRYVEAEAGFKKALEIDPESAVAMNNLGAVLFQQRKHGQAVGLFWTSLRSRPQSAAKQRNLSLALAGYFGHRFFFAAALLGPPVFLITLKAGIVTDQDWAIRVLRTYYVVLVTVWVGVRILKHRSLPIAVRDHLWHAVHLPFWAGMRDLVVFCGIVASFFHGIYLYLWWSRGSSWAPGSPLAWRLFAGFTLFLVACYAFVIGQWLRRRRLR